MSDEIKVGDRVRSYDFEDRKDCYVEGTVVYIGREFNQGEHTVAFECDRYVIKVERCVSNNKVIQYYGAFAFPPVNGTLTTRGRITNHVERV